MNYCKVKRINNIIDHNFVFYFLKRIIQRMKEISRRLWEICFSAFVVLIVGSSAPLYYLKGESYQYLVSLVLLFLALICLVIAIVAFIYDFRHTWAKEHPHYGVGFSNGKDENHQIKQ